MKILFLLHVLFLGYGKLWAQDCPEYKRLISEGDSLASIGKFIEGLNKYQSAQTHCKSKVTEVQEKIRQMFITINALKIQAEKDRQRILIEKRNTVKALETADSSYILNKRLVDAFYFYEDRFALAYGAINEGKAKLYYFIDATGKQIEKLKYWEQASQFEKNGFAKVEDHSIGVAIPLLLDTTGNLTTVSTDLNKIHENIRALDLRNKDLSILPDSIFKEQQLEILLLGNNNLDDLSEQVGNLKSLVALDLSGNQLRTLPTAISALHKLTTLNLDENKFTSFPMVICALKNLKGLSLSNDRLFSDQPNTIPPEIGELTHLMSLQMSAYNLKKISSRIGDLKELLKLNLSANKLDSLPPEIGTLGSLKNLDLANNKLRNLPSQMSQLKKIVFLDISDNPFEKDFPKVVWELESLQKLNLKACETNTSLPGSIGRLKKLEFLNISFNSLVHIPPEIGNLEKLTSLYSRGCEIKKLPKEIGKLSNLMVLDIRENELDTLPSAIGNLNHLTELWISSNRLQSLPGSICNLKNLIILDAGDNKLENLPDAIGKLKNLTELKLDNNSLTAFPEGILELTSLTSLELRHNKIIHLPPQIGKLKNLKYLYLTGTLIPNDEIKNMQALLPDCKIQY